MDYYFYRSNCGSIFKFIITVVIPSTIIRSKRIATTLRPFIFLIGPSAMKYVAIVSTNVKNTMKKVFAKIDVLPGG
jgi:hypothetical protein